MFDKVIVFVLLLTIYVEGNLLKQHRFSNHAISSQSFRREDVPLSYEYSSTPKFQQSEKYQTALKLYHKMQYAPLNRKPKDHNTTTTIPTTSAVHISLNGYSTERIFRKDHLEPRIEAIHEKIHNQSSRSYFETGHNIKVLQAVSRSPGHHSEFRSYPEYVQNEQLNKINLMRQYLTYHRPKNQVINTLQSSKTAEKEQRLSKSPTNIQALAMISNQFYGTNSNTLPSINETHPSPQLLYAKPHRLHLNVARVYSIAQTFLKAPSNARAYPANIRRPSHALAFMQQPKELEMNVPTEKNTILYPVKVQYKK